jgi:nucleoside-diphosphate-sugar epimerase
MRLFVVGATGAIGMQLMPRSLAAGHEVHGMTRSASKQAMLSELGAVPVVADAFDPDQLAEAVARAQPDVIVHQLTAIGVIDPRHFDRDFALTNRPRSEGTDHLLSAGQAAGVRRFVAQSDGTFPYARTGRAVKSEDGRSNPRRCVRCPQRWPRSAISRRRCCAPAGRQGSCCATARSTGQARR